MQCELRTRCIHSLYLVCGELLHQQTTILRQDAHQRKGKQHANRRCGFLKYFFFLHTSVASCPCCIPLYWLFPRDELRRFLSAHSTRRLSGIFDTNDTQTHTHLQMTIKPMENMQMVCKCLPPSFWFFFESEYGPHSRCLVPPCWIGPGIPLCRHHHAVGWTLPCRRWRRPGGAGLSTQQDTWRNL